MEYFVVGDEDTVLGFSLVGVAGRVVADAEEARAAFRNVIGGGRTGIIVITEPVADLIRDVIRDGTTGIIVITEPIADLIRETVDAYLFTSDFPLILEIPDRHGRDPARPGLREVVNQAIGIRV
ncbi:MAG: V-type ATP synthase subunit F [Spirochaetota bacterium]